MPHSLTHVVERECKNFGSCIPAKRANGGQVKRQYLPHRRYHTMPDDFLSYDIVFTDGCRKCKQDWIFDLRPWDWRTNLEVNGRIARPVIPIHQDDNLLVAEGFHHHPHPVQMGKFPNSGADLEIHDDDRSQNDERASLGGLGTQFEESEESGQPDFSEDGSDVDPSEGSFGDEHIHLMDGEGGPDGEVAFWALSRRDQLLFCVSWFLTSIKKVVGSLKECWKAIRDW